jgi:polyhydroxybutyrate depolymerase
MRAMLAGLLSFLWVSGLIWAADPVRKTWTVNGVEREGLIVEPSKSSSQPAPLVFGFHGHGGTSRFAARSFHIHDVWPEAYVVYLQGLPTPGKLTDPEGKKNGWQSGKGEQEDRDLKFFDVVLKQMRADYKIEDARIYSMGHSNGGQFTYILWSARPDVFAAVAPSAAVSRDPLTPKPCLHLAGEKDPLVKFAWQELMIERVKRVNGCESQGKEWAPKCTEFPSSKAAPLVTYIHPGGHEFTADGPKLIVKFFQEHTLKK